MREEDTWAINLLYFVYTWCGTYVKFIYQLSRLSYCRHSVGMSRFQWDQILTGKKILILIFKFLIKSKKKNIEKYKHVCMNSTMKYCHTCQRKRDYSHGDVTREPLRRGNSRGVADVGRSTSTWRRRHDPIAYSAHKARIYRYENTGLYWLTSTVQVTSFQPMFHRSCRN